MPGPLGPYGKGIWKISGTIFFSYHMSY
jgi:hypothetical protein